MSFNSIQLLHMFFILKFKLILSFYMSFSQILKKKKKIFCRMQKNNHVYCTIIERQFNIVIMIIILNIEKKMIIFIYFRNLYLEKILFFLALIVSWYFDP